MSLSFLDMVTTEYAQDLLIIRLMEGVIELQSAEVSFIPAHE